MTTEASSGGADAAVTVHHLGGPSALVEIDGVRLLIDPTFDGPGEYPVGTRVLTKTGAAVATPDGVGTVDAVLLSHDQHPDNLDRGGREYVETSAPIVLSTSQAADRLGGVVTALPNWTSYLFNRPEGGVLKVTGVPALHGPEGSEPMVGEVTGFVLTGEGLPTVYVSGDNASLRLVREIADRCGPIDLALLFAGGARTPLLDFAYLTLTSDEAAEAAKILDVRHVVPLHFEGWGHFTQGADTLRKAFDEAGVADRLHLIEPGGTYRL
jgi:L-ascorbate metabolism protein UlaG (beta-lactamase superfamily)